MGKADYCPDCLLVCNEISISIFLINISDQPNDQMSNPDKITKETTGQIDDQEFVALPDINDNQPDDYFYGGDPTLWQANNSPLDSDATLSDDGLIPNTDPLYPNQEEDSKVQRIQFEYDQYIEGFFQVVVLICRHSTELELIFVSLQK